MLTQQFLNGIGQLGGSKKQLLSGCSAQEQQLLHGSRATYHTMIIAAQQLWPAQCRQVLHVVDVLAAWFVHVSRLLERLCHVLVSAASGHCTSRGVAC